MVYPVHSNIKEEDPWPSNIFAVCLACQERVCIYSKPLSTGTQSLSGRRSSLTKRKCRMDERDRLICACRLYLQGGRLSSFALFLLPWRWRRHVPPKCRCIINPHCATSQKAAGILHSHRRENLKSYILGFVLLRVIRKLEGGGVVYRSMRKHLLRAALEIMNILIYFYIL
jgi:hypothetical protein